MPLVALSKSRLQDVVQDIRIVPRMLSLIGLTFYQQLYSI